MSVALLMKDSSATAQRLVPVATQQVFVAEWLPGATALGLEWVDMMETGFDVTAENRDAVVSELQKLRGWMVEHRPGSYELARLDSLLGELEGLRFELGATAFLG